MRYPENVAATAWVAGLLEGEGCFSIYRSRKLKVDGSPSEAKTYVVEMFTVDEDVALKLQDVTGIGTIRTRPPRGPNDQVGYHWRCTNKAQVLQLFEDILPYMGSRRTRKIMDIQWEAMTSERQAA